jgi:tricorn protease-like protein
MLRARPCYCILCALLGLAVAWFLLLGEIPTASAQGPKGPISFINDVAPILKENCYACHDSKKKKGKLDMTSFETLRKGGTKEDPIVDGKSKESYFIDVLVATGASRMPPKDAGDPLPKAKIDIIARWIDEGAKLDAGIEVKAEMLRELRKRWSPPNPPEAYKFPVNVNALTFTPDSKKVVVGGYHELTIWDAETGKLEKRLRTRAERAYAMVFLPDGTLAVAGGRPGQEGDVRIYDINAGVDGVSDKKVFLKELVQADDSLLALALSVDGKKLAAAGCDRIVRVWDLPSGKLEHSIENHADWVLGLAFSADGKYLATASRDKTAKVWDLAAKESLVTFPDHQNPVYGVALMPDGKIGISIGDDSSVRTWNVVDTGKNIGKQVKTMAGHSKSVFRMSLNTSVKPNLLATCSADGSVKLFDPAAGTVLKDLKGMTDWVYAVAISPDAKLVAAGGWNGEVRVWKTADGAVQAGFNASPGFVGNTADTKAPVPEKKK